jgi:3-methyladenine DNA glycosylase AlkD
MTSLEEQEVRRSIGVGVHFFAKRKPKDSKGMRRLLSVLSYLVGDRRVFVVKGVGWGLKTIGRYQPELIVEYLQETLQTTKISKLMLRKATKYFDEKTKEKMFDLWEYSRRNKKKK